MSESSTRKSSKRVTVYDVAKEAGVSAQTVSRVLNNQKYISEKSHALVSDAIDKLGYIPNRAAQMMHTQKSNTLEIMTFGDRPFKFQGPFSGMVKSSKELGYHLSFAMSPVGEVEQALNSLVSRLIDGIIFIDTENKLNGELPESIKKRIPYIFLGQPKAFKGPAVSYDQRHGICLAIEHLLELGHNKIAEISGPPNDIDAIERHEMWLELAKKNKLDCTLQRIGDFSYESGYKAALSLLEQDKSFTAILVANDSMATAAVKAIVEKGLRVPEDISVIGFDDAPHAAFGIPPLTTIAQDFDEYGKASIEHLVNRLDNDTGIIEHKLLKPTLITRQSTGKVNSAILK